MGDKDFSQIKEVRRISGEHSVNKYLRAGWKVVAVASGVDESNYPITHYTMGWLEEGKPVEPDI
ncbi:hypothetical protein ABN448_09450 [Delftia acidovorans]|uniref:hypothetical protein n=1 Tax=Delftia TaxID=80865 RepID=UPI0032D934EB